ncbi:MAG: hypothetical protein RL341_2149 [Pseudomonadota bacterium]|jgi:peptide/nickel transport system permease protein
MPKIVLLWTDIVIWLMVAGAIWYTFHVRRSPNLRASWRKVAQDAPAMCASVVLAVFVVIALLDSIHFRPLLPPAPGAPANAAVAYAAKTESLLDVLLARQIAMRERSYSLPLAIYGFQKESEDVGGKVERTFPRLAHGGAHLKNPQQEWGRDIASRTTAGLVGGALAAMLLAAFVASALARKSGVSLPHAWRLISSNHTDLPLRAMLITATILLLLAGPVIALGAHYHVLGTDRTGNNILYQALKSIRTAFVIGSITTVATLPFAVVLGVMAGYFRGWVDDVIQYIYTTLSSVPNVLLIAACVLMVQVWIDKNPEFFQTSLERADAKLFLLCIVLGLTSWALLCRLVRGEVMKLRELDYVQAAAAFGVSHWRIMARHIFPNVAHLVLISTVLAFSDLVLYEAVLSYIGVGVDPSMNSFGGMINLARSEMSRDPVVWWSFLAAFFFMVTLVLAANLVADAVQQAFDPRVRKFRVRRKPLAAAAGARSV